VGRPQQDKTQETKETRKKQKGKKKSAKGEDKRKIYKREKN
jgi:hypothetical protein